MDDRTPAKPTTRRGSLVTEQRRVIFLTAPHCQGGHSDVGGAIADLLGIPFPVTMESLVALLRADGENPAEYYRWLIDMGRHHNGGPHRFFTPGEIAAALKPAPAASESTVRPAQRSAPNSFDEGGAS